jgi:uncharacterized protein
MNGGPGIAAFLVRYHDDIYRPVGIHMATELDQKYEHLQAILRDMDSVMVAFSAGVDSTLLLKVAHDVLGERCVAATAISETYPR